MRRTAGGYTLVEVLVVVTIMGIAGALVIPSMDQTGVLKAQSAVRTIVSDITFAQTDSIAFQRGRAVMFDPDAETYRLVEVTGSTLDPENDTMYDPLRDDGLYVVELNDFDYGNVDLVSATFGTSTNLIFDEFGAPVSAPGSNEPIGDGTIIIDSEFHRYTVRVDGMTGQITTSREVLAGG